MLALTRFHILGTEIFSLIYEENDKLIRKQMFWFSVGGGGEVLLSWIVLI